MGALEPLHGLRDLGGATVVAALLVSTFHAGTADAGKVCCATAYPLLQVTKLVPADLRWSVATLRLAGQP